MEVFKFVLFLLAALTSFGCMVLLFRGYARTGVRLLLVERASASSASRSNNVLLFVDTIIWPAQIDLRLYRLGAALAGVACLLYAFIWEAE